MKLLRAKFQNFRLLRDLDLDFSNDPDRKLTVIRAANESGKTTILHGLQWALYGDEALPGKGEGFRLHPIDWNMNDGKRVPIIAMVEFELTKYRRILGEVREVHRRFRLVRSAFEEVDSQVRSGSSVRLFELNDTGERPIEAPESMIKDELPPELREVFFTDGDRALSFIEADITLSTKRERVQQAIQSLLGLGVIDDAIKHVRKSTAEVNKKAKLVGTDSELNEIASRLEMMESDHEKLDADLDDAKQQFRAFDERIDEIERKIASALQKGDKEKLRKPASCRKYPSIHAFTTRNTGFSDRSSVQFMFTASEDKPHAPMVVLARHSRASGNPHQTRKSLDSRLRGNDGLSRSLLPA